MHRRVSRTVLITNVVCWMLLAALPASAAAQLFELKPAHDRVERGEVLELVLHIQSDSTLTGVVATASLPRDFALVDSLRVPVTLRPGRYEFPFAVGHPMVTGFRRGLQTGSNVTFRVDLDYSAGAVPRHTVVTAQVLYVTALVLYLVMGLTGLLLGFWVKRRLKISAEKSGERPLKGRLLPVLVLGVLVLLYLAKDGPPAAGALDSLGFGALLGFSGDEGLMAKFSG